MNDQKLHFFFARIRRTRLALAAAGLWLCASYAGAQAHNPSFSADQVKTVLKKTTTSKVYSSEKAVRVETEQKGRLGITILRLDQKAVWNLDPVKKTYMDMGALGSASMDLANSAADAKSKRDLVGSEQVGAYHCDKYHVQTTYEGQVFNGFEWDAKELNGFPVKQADEKGSWSKEYQNVKLGPQDPTLFEIPPGYTKIDLGGLFKR